MITLITILPILTVFRVFQDGIPVTSTFSTAVASACHSGVDEPAHVAELSLTYDKARNLDGSSVTWFTSRRVESEGINLEQFLSSRKNMNDRAKPRDDTLMQV